MALAKQKTDNRKRRSKKNADSERVNWPAVAKAYRTLLEGATDHDLDAIESIHSSTVEGPRVLRLGDPPDGRATGSGQHVA